MATFPLARRLAELDRHNAETLARFDRETTPEPAKVARGATAAGDERRLRGVPIQARGVPGAIRGTRPGSNL